MSTVLNAYQQPIGFPVSDWTTRPTPQRRTIEGRSCRLEPLDPERHADDLYAAYGLNTDDRDWTYLPIGPFDNPDDFRGHIESAAKSTDPFHFAVIDAQTGRAVGTFALMRIDPKNGVIEVGMVVFSPLLKRTPISTEAQYLLMRHVFEDLGYRRYEWKCDDLNTPSRNAALRLGFQFEGVFRQAIVYKGRSRDTVWFSVIDREWPTCRDAFEQWLAPDNFDPQGRQIRSLGSLRKLIAV